MTRTLRSALRALVLVPAAAGLAHAQDPFAPGERWKHAAPPAAPYLPDGTHFAGDDSFVWVGARGPYARALVLDAVATGPVDPREVDGGFAGAHGALLTAAGRRGDALFALAQYPDPDVARRRPELTRHDPLASAAGAPFAPAWRHDLGVRINGPTRLACDGEGDLVAAAAWDDRTANVRLDLVDGTTGALRARVDLPALALAAVAVSDDGSRVAVSAGLDLWILDSDGVVRHHHDLAAASHALALSGDGSTVAVGSIAQLALLRETPSGWALSTSFLASQGEIASRAALSADGGTLAVAWWDYTNGVDARFELWDAQSHQRLSRRLQAGDTGGRQNLPVAVRITADGSRAAFGTWGNGVDPEVVLLEAGDDAPVLVVDLPGSVTGLDLDATGTRLAVAHKDVHANTFGATGTVRLVATGERPLAALETPTLGGRLRMAARHPGAGAAIFLWGDPLDAPVALPGVEGALLLDRSTLRGIVRPTDADGRADVDLPIGTLPSLLGAQLHVQVAFRTSGAPVLPPMLVEPYVLD